MPEAAIRIAIRQIRYTNGVAAPENGVENCGLKNVETAGPMIAADMITAPVSPTALRRNCGTAGMRGAAVDAIPAPLRCARLLVRRCLTSDDFCVKAATRTQRRTGEKNMCRRDGINPRARRR